MNNTQIIFINSVTRLYTNIKVRLGKPQLYNTTNPNVSNISPIIPADATFIPSTDLKKEECKVINQLTWQEKTWTIKVRVTNKCQKKEFKTNKGEAIVTYEFLDKKNTNITAYAYEGPGYKSNSSLEKGKMYMISNGEIRYTNKKHTATDHNYSIKLNEDTVIKEIEDDETIGYYKFNFITIREIYNTESGTIIDVLGVIIQMDLIRYLTPKNKPTTEESKQLLRRIVAIADETQVRIDLMLWNDYAKEEFKIGDIIAINKGKVGVFDNRKQLHSDYFTHVYLNPHNPRVEFLEKLMKNGTIFQANNFTMDTTLKFVHTIYVVVFF